MATLNLQVGTGTDDAFEDSTGGVNTTGFTGLCDASNEFIGLRWQNIAIEQGTIITSAILSVMPSTGSNDEPLHRIWGEATDNSATFSAGAGTFGISGRARTTAAVDWDNPNLGANGTTFFSAPAVTAIIQEIIDRPGWSSGNSLAIIISQPTTSSFRDLDVTFYETAAASAAKLDISYYVAPSKAHNLLLRGVG